MQVSVVNSSEGKRKLREYEARGKSGQKRRAGRFGVRSEGRGAAGRGAQLATCGGCGGAGSGERGVSSRVRAQKSGERGRGGAQPRGSREATRNRTSENVPVSLFSSVDFPTDGNPAGETTEGGRRPSPGRRAVALGRAVCDAHYRDGGAGAVKAAHLRDRLASLQPETSGISRVDDDASALSHRRNTGAMQGAWRCRHRSSAPS